MEIQLDEGAEMKQATMILLLAALALPCLAGTTIEYSYDRQHRLVQASYSASEKVYYSYDAANNLDVYAAITDGQYLKSFLYWLSSVVPRNWLAPFLAHRAQDVRTPGGQA